MDYQNVLTALEPVTRLLDEIRNHAATSGGKKFKEEIPEVIANLQRLSTAATAIGTALAKAYGPVKGQAR